MKGIGSFTRVLDGITIQREKQPGLDIPVLPVNHKLMAILAMITELHMNILNTTSGIINQFKH
jgi:hypothetical protein